MTTQSRNPLTARIGALLTRFRRQRPLRAGSLLVTILGDAIAPRGGKIALGSLIELARPFGLTERLVRTSIGRLANEQWVSSERSGRSSFYSLTSYGRGRFAEATQRIYGASPQAWDGQWTLVIVPASLKQQRDSLRHELAWLGFGQIAPGVFVHPTHTEETIRARLAELESTGELIVIQGARIAQTSDANLVAIGWDFGDLARRYRRFASMFRPLDEGRAQTLSGETAFILRTLLLHEYRKIHLRDPLLPAALLPPDWAGAEAQEICRRLYAKVFPASEQYLSSAVQTMAGSLPAPSREIFRRFGGLPRS